MKRLLTFAALAALAAPLTVALPAAAAEVYTIPVVMSLTGSAAFLGKSEAQALVNSGNTQRCR